jgi:hypothetical protein
MLPQRIQDKIEVEGDCWIWHGTTRPDGYGLIWWDGRMRRAHRKVYELMIGDPGPVLDHLCRRRNCVNPDHLEPVTNTENLRRAGLWSTAKQRHKGRLSAESRRGTDRAYKGEARGILCKRGHDRWHWRTDQRKRRGGYLYCLDCHRGKK